jgi:hypothetical protein
MNDKVNPSWWWTQQSTSPNWWTAVPENSQNIEIKMNTHTWFQTPAGIEYVFNLIRAERLRQDEKWGEQDHPDGTGTLYYQDKAREATEECRVAFAEGAGDWALILLEEVFEALAESDDVRLISELTEVAAVATAWIEAIKRRQAND